MGETFAGVLHRVMSEADQRCALIGRHAVNFWVEPQFTHDFDLTVEPDRAKFQRVVAQLVADGFAVKKVVDPGDVPGPDFVRLARGRTHDFVDLLAAKDAFQQELLRRAVRESPDILPVATPEDLVVLALVADRPKDHATASQLAEARKLDWQYIETWAQRWGIAERVAALRAASIDPNVNRQWRLAEPIG